MTILLAYAPRPEGQAALDKALELAKKNGERLVVINASPGGHKEDPSMAFQWDIERIAAQIEAAGVDGEVKQFVRGNAVLAEIEDLVASLQVSMLVIGLRKRNPVGKLIMGSLAQEILLSVPCPVLAVKAL
jgi:nucleotide-binding universal stress UspA family protein